MKSGGLWDVNGGGFGAEWLERDSGGVNREGEWFSGRLFPAILLLGL